MLKKIRTAIRNWDGERNQRYQLLPSEIDSLSWKIHQATKGGRNEALCKRKV